MRATLPARSARLRPSGAVVSIAALALCACEPSLAPPLGGHGADGSPTRGGWLRMANYADLRSLDAAVAFDDVSAPVEDLLYDRLVAFDPSTRDFVGQLAERWERSGDGLRYTFHLRPGVRFHDGSELSARDVKRTFERALRPTTPCPVASFYERIKGFADFNHGRAEHLEGVIVEGAYDLTFELSRPDATWLALLALPTAAPVCPSAGDTYARDFSLHPCGAGPFELASWEPGRELRLSRFEGYWRPGLPYLDGVSWSFVTPPFTQRLKFERGQQDFIRDLTGGDLRLFLRDPAWHGLGQWEEATDTRGVFLNTAFGPFRERELRRAVASAIDRDELARVRPDNVAPASRMVPPALPGYDPRPGQRFDYAAALGHMRAAGYAYDPHTGRGGYPHEITFVAVGDNNFGSQAAQLYQQQLARVGLRVRLRLLGWPAYLAETSRRGVAEMGSDGWNADFADASDFFESVFASRAINDEDSQNRAFYSNPELDALLDGARGEADPERRRAAYERAEAIVDDDAPWAITYRSRWYDLRQGYVRGYRPNPGMVEQVRFTWLDRAAASTEGPLGLNLGRSARSLVTRRLAARAAR